MNGAMDGDAEAVPRLWFAGRDRRDRTSGNIVIEGQKAGSVHRVFLRFTGYGDDRQEGEPK